MTTDLPNPSKPRRRWFQFSLGSLFVLLTVLCVWLGVTVVGVTYAILLLKQGCDHKDREDTERPDRWQSLCIVP